MCSSDLFPSHDTFNNHAKEEQNVVVIFTKISEREIKISPKAETRNILYGELLKEPFTLGGDSKLTAEQRKQLLAAIKDYIRVGGVK